MQEAEVEVDKVVRHVFHKQSPRRISGLLLQQVPHHFVAVAIHCRHHVGSGRVIGARHPEVVTVERLVDNAHVVPLSETVHQRRRHVARA